MRERHRRCSPGCRAGNRSSRDRRSSRHLSKCEAQARGAGCRRWGYDCRRLCSSPHGDSRNAESLARRLSWSEALGSARATIEYLRRNVFERELVESLAWPTQSSWPESSSRKAFPRERECIRKRWLLSWCTPATMPLSILLRTPSCKGLRLVSKTGDVVAILSNGGFDGIYEKLPRRLEHRDLMLALSQCW